MNRQIILERLPEGAVTSEHFALVEGPAPQAAAGDVLCRTLLLSIDPANRAWMLEHSYRERIEPGQLMPGFTLSEIVDPGDSELAAGTIVACEAGWQEQAALPREAVDPITVRGPLSHHLGVLGITGVTAHVGLFDVGRPRPGETVLVSAAAGATGSVAGQLARLAGCRVVGIAGSAEKCAALVERLGFDAAVDRSDPDVRAALRRACPNGVDVYFDNVGGPLLDTVLARMNLGGRIVCCGVVSELEHAEHRGARLVPSVIVTRRLRMEGFIVLDHRDRWPAAEEQIAGWIASGDLVPLEDVSEGLQHAPGALVDVLAGRNLGKRLIRVADPAGPSGRAVR